jgi:hypothetical protein
MGKAFIQFHDYLKGSQADTMNPISVPVTCFLEHTVYHTSVQNCKHWRSAVYYSILQGRGTSQTITSSLEHILVAEAVNREEGFGIAAIVTTRNWRPLW